jgi:transcriptional antiterminator RfaH
MHDLELEIPTPQPWFVAQLKPNGFIMAKQNLKKQGYRVFMPMHLREIRHARKVKTVTRPVFPGYIFVSFDPETTQWRCINSTYGVSSLIMGGATSPQIAPADLMHSLLERCGGGDLVLAPEVLMPGNVVRVVKGPFKDVIAEVEHLSGNDRIGVLLDLMGRKIRVEIRRENLEIKAA